MGMFNKLFGKKEKTRVAEFKVVHDAHKPQNPSVQESQGKYKVHTVKFCKLMQKTVEFTESQGEVYCLSQGQDPGCNCAEAMFSSSMAGTPEKICKYSITGKSIAKLRKDIVLTNYADDVIESAIVAITGAGKPPCDVCGRAVTPETGFLLSTSQVVGSEDWWNYLFTHSYARGSS